MSRTALATLCLPYSTLAKWISGTWTSPGFETEGGVGLSTRVDGRVEWMAGTWMCPSIEIEGGMGSKELTEANQAAKSSFRK